MILPNLPKDIVVRFERRWTMRSALAIAAATDRQPVRQAPIAECVSIADPTRPNAAVGKLALI